MKLYCGLDIHKNFHVGCIMDEKGKILEHVCGLSPKTYNDKMINETIGNNREFRDIRAIYPYIP